MQAEDMLPKDRQALGYAAALCATIMTLGFGRMIPAVQAGEAILYTWNWAPSLGVSLAFMVDGLSLIFALLISGIGAMIFLYATGYMGDHPQFGRFVAYLFAFMISMLGLVLARDLITLFVFWELTSITSYLLIGFDHENAQARRSALQAMLVTAAGGLALLAGFILMGATSGSFDLAEILRGPGLQDSRLYGAILVLVLLGTFTKSAQFPFHFWLPNAMAAPTPVSAYLHSATMVKAGVYLLARLHPVLGGTGAWVIALTLAGLVTAVMASVLAFRQSDLKQILAYTTLMALGTITLLLAHGSPAALTAAITFLVVHSLYKAALFMVAGAIDHATGTREIAQLGGLARAMPLTAAAALFAGASMAGLPPMIGWIGKELIYTAAIGIAGLPWLIAVVVGVLIANALMFAIAGMVGLRPFVGATHPASRVQHEVPWQMLTGPVLLAALGLITGLFAEPLLGRMIASAVTHSLGAEHAAGLHLWAGINLPLMLSLMTFALGLWLYAARNGVRGTFDATLIRLPRFDDGWDRFLILFRRFANWQTRTIQTGHLTHYLITAFVVLTVAVGGTALIRKPMLRLDFTAPLVLWVIVTFTMAGAFLAGNARSRITAIAGVGTVGIGVALIFITFGAPDVATTQLMVEVLATVLFGIAALRLPGIATTRRSPRKRALHALISGGVGLTVTLVILAVTSHPLDRHITTYFEDSAYLLAHGRNIVNVVLVDFRAFDTLGELTVVVLAAVGAFAMLGRRPRKEP